jgi:hypothetical protein
MSFFSRHGYGRMFLLLLAMFVIAIPSVSYAQATQNMPKIAVYVSGAKTPAVNKSMVDGLITALANSGRYQVAENYKDFFYRMTAEPGSGAKSMNAEQIKRLGKQFGVQYICIAEIATVLDENEISARIVNVETGESGVLCLVDCPLKSQTDATDVSGQIVSILIKNAPSSVPIAGVLPPPPAPPPLPPSLPPPQAQQQVSGTPKTSQTMPYGAQTAQQYTTADAGKGMSITIRDMKAIGLGEGESQYHLPRKIQAGFMQNFLTYAPNIKVTDWESFLKVRDALTDAAYDDNSEAVRNAIRAQIPTTHFLMGEITKTPTGYDLHVGIFKTTGMTTVASFTGKFSFWELDNLTGVGRASLELFSKIGVTLTEKARKELSGAATQDHVNEVKGQLALAEAISADRRGNKVEALNYYIQAANYNPSLRDRSSKLTADIFSGNMGSDILNDIQWRKQWVERLKETEEFFDNFNKIESMPYTLFYGSDIKRGATNYQNETVPISIETYLYGSQVWAHSIEEVLQKVYDGLNATGQKNKWGLSNWPQQGVTNLNVFAERRNRFSVVFELVNSQQKVIGRQTLNAAGSWKINLSDRTSISFGTTRENVVFQNVSAMDITPGLTVRVASVNGVDAETATINGILQMRNINKSEFDLNDRFRYAMGQIQGFARGGGASDLVIPSTIWGDPVTSISNGAFNGSRLSSVTIPNSVEFIGSEAFWNTGITSLTIGPNVRMSYNSFGGSTFQSFPECYKKVGKKRYKYKQSDFRFAANGEIQGFVNNTSNVTTIDIPANIWGIPVTSIAAGAFKGNRLRSVNIPNSVRYIGEDAFSCTECRYDFREYRDVTAVMSITIGANVDMNENPFRFSEYINSSESVSCGQNCYSSRSVTKLVINDKFEKYYDKNDMKSGTYHYFVGGFLGVGVSDKGGIWRYGDLTEAGKNAKKKSNTTLILGILLLTAGIIVLSASSSSGN